MTDNIQDKLQKLFVTYTQRLPNKVRRIRASWLDLQTEWDKQAFIALHRDVHSLCGSAGTYGYQEVSHCARQLEKYLKSEMEADSPAAIDQHYVADLLSQLQSSVERAIRQNRQDMRVESEAQVEKTHIYLVGQDGKLECNVVEALKHAGYQASGMPDLICLETAVCKVKPAAIILDTDYLAENWVGSLQRIRKEHQLSCPVFCIVPNTDLMPRLQSVRAGCDGFFQKPVDAFQLTQTLNQKLSTETNEAWRILIVDDSESLAEYYSLILNQAGMIAHAISAPLQLLDELAVFQPNLILMDIYMPGCTGLELAAILRYEHRYMKIPIIFLSTEDDRHKQLSAMSLGGDDFLTKPVSPQHLASVVRSRAKRAGMLEYFMTTDSLTGLLNHASVLCRLDMEIVYARQKKTPLSFIMVDIDHFKGVNDSYGHPVGDSVLRQLSNLFLVRLRSQDIIGRYGGEEFAIILPGTNAAQCLKICDELRQQFASYDFNSDSGHFSLTFSAGFSCLRDDNNANSLVLEADQMLYQAKQNGRNRVQGFERQPCVGSLYFN